jgi:hypothetical protein
MRKPVANLRGERFGYLRVPETAAPLRSSPTSDIRWPCVCDCGATKRVFAFNLTSGGTVSCGCWRANPQLRATAKLKRLEDRRPAIAKLRESNDKRSQPAAPAAAAAGLREIRDQYLRSAGPPILQQLPDLAADPAHPLPRHSRQRRFLVALLGTGGNVSRAAVAAHLSRRIHYRWLENDPAFQVACARTEREAAQVLEDEARRRAFEGVLKAVYYKGKVVGYELQYSDRLMIQLLKANHPAHKPAARQASSGQSGERPPAPWIGDEGLVRLPEEKLLTCIRVLREALDYVGHKVEAAPQPHAEDLAQDQDIAPEAGAMTEVRAIGEEAGGEHPAQGSEGEAADTGAGPAPMPNEPAGAMADGGH